MHVVTHSPSYRHQHALARLYDQLAPAVNAHAGWEVLWSPADIVLSPKTLVQPDLFVVRLDPEREPEGWRDVGIPLLAIEVLSPATAARDRVTKRHLYRRAGVAEYWIVDLDARVIERWRPADERPEVCDGTLEWSLPDGPSGFLQLAAVFGP